FRVPAESPGDRDPRARDPDFDRGDVRHHVFPRLFDQQLHAARAHDRHRHRGGRRDHRARERLPAPGGTARGAAAGRGQRQERGFNALADRYAKLLQTALRHRGIVVAGTLVTVALAFVLYLNLKQELIPDDDRGFFLVVAFAPEGSSLEYTDGYVRQVEQIIGKTPGVQGYFTIIGGFAGGVNRAFVGVILKDWSERHNSVQQL